MVISFILVTRLLVGIPSRNTLPHPHLTQEEKSSQCVKTDLESPGQVSGCRGTQTQICVTHTQLRVSWAPLACLEHTCHVLEGFVLATVQEGVAASIHLVEEGSAIKHYAVRMMAPHPRY